MVSVEHQLTKASTSAGPVYWPMFYGNAILSYEPGTPVAEPM